MQAFIELGFWKVSIILFGAVVLRYFVLAGFFHLVFSPEKAMRENTYTYKKLPRRKQYLGEIAWSLFTSVLFALLSSQLLIWWSEGKTLIYTEWSAYALWYIPFSIIIALLIHETQYYWLHRWMHHPSVFRFVHKVHHQSLSTTSWTAFSFHPVEGLLQMLMLAAITFLVPLHYLVLLGLLIFMTLSSIINHMGVDFYPNNTLFKKWVIGAEHHAMHHKHFDQNYGLYFTFWDRWMGTEKGVTKP